MPSRPDPAEDSASFEGMGQAIAARREQRGLSREELAERVGLSGPSLEAIEKGEVDADWGTLRKLAQALDVGLDALLEEAEGLAPGPGGEQWRRWTREARRGEEE